MVVYHYCNIDSFYEIITNKSLRLSDITKSNDSMEILWFSQYINEIFNNTYLNEKAKYFSVKYPQEIFDYLVNDYQNSYFGDENQKYKYFVFCFSENGDLLSQWRGYADDGEGISIGFDSYMIENISRPNNIDSILSFDKVVYKENEQKRFIRQEAEYLIHKLKTLLLKTDVLNNDDDLKKKSRKDFFTCFWILFERSIFIKNPFFKEEKEWRLCYFTDINDLNINSNQIKLNNDFYLNKINFQCRNNKLISYIDLDFKKCINPFIKEIIIGPKSKLTEYDIDQFLLNNNIKIDKNNIRKSRGTYR